MNGKVGKRPGATLYVDLDSSKLVERKFMKDARTQAHQELMSVLMLGNICSFAYVDVKLSITSTNI